MSRVGNEIEFKVQEAKRLMGIEVHQDGDGNARISECNGLNKREANINLMVQWKKDLRLPTITF